MLAVAARARSRYAPEATLIYECLDIHRLLLSRGLAGSVLRRIESRLWRQVDLLLTSSPAFLRSYFEPRAFPAPARLVENKVLLLDGFRDLSLPGRPPGPPWRIGWFGMIRCRKSLEILRSLASKSGGAVEVIIRGRPSDAVFPDFARSIAGSPHLSFAGPYRNPEDLQSIYGEAHFNWVIDYFEEGQNSAWLLPNRVYEGGMFGAVPIALAGVETANWLRRQEAGVALSEPLEQSLHAFFSRLDPSAYSHLASKVAALPRRNLIDGPDECRELVRALCRGTARPDRRDRYSEVPA
jgi:succinoglycan biosynthesis protein ExoL